MKIKKINTSMKTCPICDKKITIANRNPFGNFCGACSKKYLPIMNKTTEDLIKIMVDGARKLHFSDKKLKDEENEQSEKS